MLATGAGAAVLAGILIAVFFMAKGAAPPPENSTTTKGGLQVETAKDDAKVDPTRPLRCFVGGQFIGMVSLADCAKRNGVAAQALDVGLDQTGALAAASTGGQTVLRPLPPPAPIPPPPVVAPVAAPPRAIESPPTAIPAVTPPAVGPPIGDCLRFAGDGWRSAGGALSLNACVHILFEGHCERPGGALYGRWGAQTLRLLPGRVESSPDNRNFRPLADQNPRDCSIPAL